jgi:hypothetical protein
MRGAVAAALARIRDTSACIVWPFTNQDTLNAITASASKRNSEGQPGLAEDGSRFGAAARRMLHRIVRPHAR